MPKKKPYGRGAHAIEALTARINRAVDAASLESSAARLRLYWIVSRLGGVITVGEGPSLVVNAENDFTIYVSPFTSPLRDNFTIAHELGHLIMHCDRQAEPGETVSFARYGDGLEEREANRFAAALLMPEEKMRMLREDGYSISRISGVVEVPAPAVEVRLKCLGILEEVNV